MSRPLPVNPRLRALLTLLVAVMMHGCLIGSEGTGEPKLFPEALSKLEAAKALLEKGEYLEAKIELEKLINDEGDFSELAIALNFDPVAKDQARYMFVLADTLNQINDWLETLSTLLGIAQQFGALPEFAPGMTPQAWIGEVDARLETAGGTGLVASTLDSFVKEFSDFFAGNASILAEVKKNPDFAIRFNTLPIKFNALPVKLMDLKGEHDLAEALFLDSVFLVADGLMQMVLATDFSVDFGATDAFTQILNQIDLLFDAENPPLVSILSNVAAVVLASQNRLLGLADAEAMKTAGVQFATAMDDLSRALDFIANETDDQTDDLVALVEKDERGFTIQLNIDFSATPIVNIDTLDEVQFNVNQEVLDGVDNIAAAFAGETSVRINWSRDLVPLISVLTTAMVRSGFAQAVIEAVLELSGQDASAIADLDSLLSSSLINEDLISGVLRGVIPDVLEFDVGQYFKAPKGWLRDWLPFWTLPVTRAVTDVVDGKTVTETVTVWEDVRLFLEFECDDSLSPTGDTDPTNAPRNPDTGAEDFLCEGQPSYLPTDLDHFTPEYFPQITTPEFRSTHSRSDGTDYTINLCEMTERAAVMLLDEHQDKEAACDDGFGLSRDGTKAILGMLAFRDPTFSGILYIRLAETEPETEVYNLGSNVFFPATNRSINALMQQLFNQILSLF